MKPSTERSLHFFNVTSDTESPQKGYNKITILKVICSHSDTHTRAHTHPHAHYRFSCTGEVTSWEAYTTGTGSHPIQFQVWREISGTRRYRLVGNNTFLAAAPMDGILRLNVPLDERFTVVSDDIVGVSVMEGNEEDPFQILTVCGTSTVYNLTDSGFTDGVLQLGSFFGVDCSITPSRFFDASGLTMIPLINAVLDGEGDTISYQSTYSALPLACNNNYKHQYNQQNCA